MYHKQGQRPESSVKGQSSRVKRQSVSLRGTRHVNNLIGVSTQRQLCTLKVTIVGLQFQHDPEQASIEHSDQMKPNKQMVYY